MARLGTQLEEVNRQPRPGRLLPGRASRGVRLDNGRSEEKPCDPTARPSSAGREGLERADAIDLSPSQQLFMQSTALSPGVVSKFSHSDDHGNSQNAENSSRNRVIYGWTLLWRRLGISFQGDQLEEKGNDASQAREQKMLLSFAERSGDSDTK